ncbi:predicted protein [Chaetoceros tenuissimus]|uniref:Uncharacterized protein n=1 Tax=Chaetoceros tenuissimus TaxID=426638 RepID=A0AAD3CNZ4_9STRA|nr:predicted protein [Chaetoceros tenuissimus]
MNALRVIHKIHKEHSQLTLSREDQLKVTRPLTEIAEEEEGGEGAQQPCGRYCRRDCLITKKKHSAVSIEGPESYAGNEVLTSDESIDYYKSLAPQMYERIMTRRNKIKPERILPEEERRSRGRSRTESFKEEIGKEQILENNCDKWPNEENGNREEDDDEIIFDLEL